jgi:hypothetical protein
VLRCPFGDRLRRGSSSATISWLTSSRTWSVARWDFPLRAFERVSVESPRVPPAARRTPGLPHRLPADRAFQSRRLRGKSSRGVMVSRCRRPGPEKVQDPAFAPCGCAVHVTVGTRPRRFASWPCSLSFDQVTETAWPSTAAIPVEQGAAVGRPGDLKEGVAATGENPEVAPVGPRQRHHASPPSARTPADGDPLGPAADAACASAEPHDAPSSHSQTSRPSASG